MSTKEKAPGKLQELTQEEIEAELALVEKTREEVLSALPWYKRFYKRYFTGDAVKVSIVSSLQTDLKWIIGGFLFFKQPLLTFLAAKMPWVLSAAKWIAVASSKVWAFICTAFGVAFKGLESL